MKQEVLEETIGLLSFDTTQSALNTKKLGRTHTHTHTHIYTKVASFAC
jgi:hypothetical protein